MIEFSKIGYFDLRLESKFNRLPKVFGFGKESDRLSRILLRSLQHNVILSAPSGVGKTSLVFAWAQIAAPSPLFLKKKMVMLDSGTLQKIGQLPTTSLQVYQEAFNSLKDTIVVLDSFGEMIYQNPQALQNWNTVLKPLFFKDDISMVLTMQPDELEWLRANKSHFLSHFEILKLEGLSETEQLDILKNYFEKFSKSVDLQPGVLEMILKICKRFPVLGQMPKSAIQLLDECVAEAKGINIQTPFIEKSLVEKIATEKTGVPLNRGSDDKEMLKNLPSVLVSKVVGQQNAIYKMTSVITRAALGLRTQHKPLGSFLVLGPSGVGKTETAKILAENLYGSDKNFLRVDMSEFSQPHDTSRLLGSPAGYVGYEEGGQLTNHFKNYPYSLLLLDEIEKAHSKIFDIFLQILDDGRITSARGEVVDLSQGIIVATSNMAVQEILEGVEQGEDVHSEEFLKHKIIPALLKYLRMEFINRFDAILVYKPLSAEDLTDIALLEIAKIEKRMSEHKIKFNVSREALKAKLQQMADPRFGARPVKRFVEEVCENLITQKLLQ
ncbi:MAG: ATP-dependent Clp protease ATP-binding subunit [Candidatus Doudnabacteria bacterium]|nr:ATP-dependent Clp protease ATP-binding subunit [Candidatus Doudnabacteria bacterium]